MAAFATVVATTGWLYLLRPQLLEFPGPKLRDALPFDELASRARVPLLGFLAVWAVTGVLLALIVRAARAERLTAALLLAVGVGAWGYVSSGVTLLVVRQITGDQAFDAAAQVRAVYVAAAIAGLAGAIGGRVSASARPRAPLVLAWLVAAVGALGVLDLLLTGHRPNLIGQLAPEHVYPLSRAVMAPVGLALIVVARGLARRRRHAWEAAVALLGGLTVLHVLHGFDYGAAATALVGVALVASRHDFSFRGDSGQAPRVLARAAIVVGAVYSFGLAALWVNRVMADQPFTLRFAVRETTSAALGLRLHGSVHLTGTFGDWFPLAILLVGIAGAWWVLLSWLAPWRYRVRQEARERPLARDLVRLWGSDTLAPFALRADKSYFFDSEERAFVAYRVVGGVAIVSGDPIGPPERFPALVESFIAFARARDWRVAVLGASEHRLALYQAHGLHALYHGDEAVIETARFSLEGRPIRKVRQSVHRLERARYYVRVLRPREIDGSLREELEAIAQEWRGGDPERGFAMALDALFRLEDPDAVFVVGFDRDGVAGGFLHFAVCRAGSALSLSSMPRRRTTPNGFNEWLVCEAVAWARENGLARVSLNFAPFAALLAPEAELSALQRIERGALLRLKGHFQLDNLLLFNRKFFPSWQSRFVVYERRLDLPRIGIAALAAEAYLPFVSRERT